MNAWLQRGLVFASVVVVARLVQGTLIDKVWPSQAGLISLLLLVIYLPVPVIWGFLDGRADARAHPDPDRRDDLAMVWLLTGLVAGVVSGVVCWFISLFYRHIYVGGLLNECTTFAAATALLAFITALIGVTVGRWIVDRQLAKAPVHHHGLAARDEERVDTDVFAAVRPDDTATQGRAMPREQATAVATVEREEHAAPPAYGESPTEEIKLSDVEQPTAAAPTQADAQQTKPSAKPEEGQR